jgi:hypothetical protein
LQNMTFSDCLALRQYIGFTFNLQKINSAIRIPKPHTTGGPQRYTVHKVANISFTENIRHSFTCRGFNIITKRGALFGFKLHLIGFET